MMERAIRAGGSIRPTRPCMSARSRAGPPATSWRRPAPSTGSSGACPASTRQEIPARLEALRERWRTDAPQPLRRPTAGSRRSSRSRCPALRPTPARRPRPWPCGSPAATAPTRCPSGPKRGHYQAAGIPTVVCGPGSINQAHQPDEYITLEQLEAGEAFMRRLAACASASVQPPAWPAYPVPAGDLGLDLDRIEVVEPRAELAGDADPAVVADHVAAVLGREAAHHAP